MGLPATRLFFALWPDDAVKQRLLLRARQVNELRTGKNVPHENFHLTLAFLGEVPFARVDRLLRVARAVEMRPFTVCIDQVGYWPKAQALWLGPREVPQPMSQLVDDIWAASASMGFEREARPFQPHITICRKMGEAPQLKDADPVLWEPDDFALIESRPEPDGRAYTVLYRFPVMVERDD
jgi:2'-5' RNA ligase